MKGLLKILFWLVLLFGGIALSIYLDKHILHFQRVDSGLLYYLSFVLGIFLLVGTFNKVSNIGRTLAKYGHKTKTKQRTETDQLVTKGPYALMQHPMHQSLMQLPLAAAFQTVSPSFIFIIAPLEILLIYFLIITIEEPELQKRFGKEYDDYRAKTPRFCFS